MESPVETTAAGPLVPFLPKLEPAARDLERDGSRRVAKIGLASGRVVRLSRGGQDTPGAGPLAPPVSLDLAEIGYVGLAGLGEPG